MPNYNEPLNISNNERAFYTDKTSDLTAKLEAAEAKVAECMIMLDNVKYWEGCPDEYKERIEKLQAKENC